MRTWSFRIISAIAIFAFVESSVHAESPATKPLTANQRTAVQKIGKDAALTFGAAELMFENLPDQPYAHGKAHQNMFSSALKAETKDAAPAPSRPRPPAEHHHYQADIGIDCKLVPAGTATVTVDPEDGPPFEVDCRHPEAGLKDQKIVKRKGPFCSCLQESGKYCEQERARITKDIIPQVWPPQCYKCSVICNIVNVTDQPGTC